MKKWMKFLHRDSMIQEEVYDGPLIKLENLVKIYDTGAIKVLGLKKINLTIERGEFVAIIGTSGSGKSTLLRCINLLERPNQGEVRFHGRSITGRGTDASAYRTRVGMVFQQPSPFPKSIYDNVAYGPRVQGITSQSVLDGLVETSLKQAAIWDELKDRLNTSALGLSGGQQQRLCIARTLAAQPSVILMDEPTSALDPISTQKIEDLALELKRQYTIVIVTHNMQQAKRISDRTAFFYLGELVEMDRTEKLFTNPDEPRTESYITGRFG